MKIKKLLLTALTGALLLGSLTACGSKDDDKKESTTAATTEKKAEATTDDNKAEGAFISFNGVDLQGGQVFDDVKDKLGAETKPSDRIEPCGGGDYIQIIHYYDGLELTTLRDEKIVGLSIPMDSKSTAAINGKITNGASAADIKAVLGDKPDMEDADMISYSFGKTQVNFYFSNGAMNGCNFMYME
ncbi:hypothetical protein SAMN04487934_10491 [Eubacterium ruminantium]|nr:hypothetical protein SAMN04487934_10491 [Eubacterium ruminantium]